jgi:cellulose biosynthesis protein BcsQ
MPKIIGIAKLKGGSGRSTLACNLAGELSKIGTTVLIDCDVPQGASSSWAALRAGGVPNSSLHTETAASQGYRDLHRG